MKDKLEIKKERNYIISKSNEIIQRARVDLTLSEIRLLNYVFSLIKPTDTELHEYKIRILDYCALCGITDRSGSNYIYAKKSVKNLADKSFWMMNEEGEEVLIRWVEKAKVDRGKGIIEIRLDNDLKKYVVGLHGNFTQYTMLNTLTMSSTYSIAIYELLKSYSYNHSTITFRLDELRKHLGCINKYPSFKEFRRNVLEVSRREINLYTDLDITYEKLREGREVTAIKYYITKKAHDEYLETIENNNDMLDGQLTINNYLNGKSSFATPITINAAEVQNNDNNSK